MQFALEYLDEIIRAFEEHRGTVERILKEYRETVNSYGNHYKPEYLNEMKSKARGEAAASIAQADKTLQRTVKSKIESLRRELCMNVVDFSEKDKNVLYLMNLYGEKGEKLTETEIRGFYSQGAHCYPVLRMLRVLAQDSGFRLVLPSIEELEKDMKRIESGVRVPSMYAPAEYYREASEVLGKKTWFRDDGSVYQRSGETDAVYLSLVETARERLEKDMDTVIRARWDGWKSINIERIDNKSSVAGSEAADSNSTEEAQQDRSAEERAKQASLAAGLNVTQEEPNGAAYAAQEAESRRRSAEILRAYLKK